MSRGDRFLLIAVLAAVGIGDSAYLAWQWYESANAAWCDFGSFFSCSRVRESPYAAVDGIPTAWAGVVGFAILLALAIMALRGTERLGSWSVERWILRFAFLGAILGFLLTLVEVFVIQAICILCVIGFVLDLGVFGIAWLLTRPDG